MNIFELFGVNPSDTVSDAFQLAERAVLALESIARDTALIVWHLDAVHIPAEGPGNDGTGARAAALRTRETTR
jgi:hypothetical protein